MLARALCHRVVRRVYAAMCPRSTLLKGSGARMVLLPLLGYAAWGCAEGPRFGLEYESERDRRAAVHNHGITLKPGWQFDKDRLINVAEVLIDRNEDASADADGIRARETKVFLRLRHNRKLDDKTGYYLRGGIGRSFNNQRDFTYAYLEPGLTREFGERGAWVFGWREIDAIDGTAGERVRKYISGPSINLDRNNEIELRYVRATRDKDAWSWTIGYTRRF